MSFKCGKISIKKTSDLTDKSNVTRLLVLELKKVPFHVTEYLVPT